MMEIEDKCEYGICLNEALLRDALEKPDRLRMGLAVKYPSLNLLWGDIIWIKEPWQFLEFRTEGHFPARPNKELLSEGSRYGIAYKYLSVWRKTPATRGFKWRSPVTMPRWASRIQFVRKDTFEVIGSKDYYEALWIRDWVEEDHTGLFGD